MLPLGAGRRADPCRSVRPAVVARNVALVDRVVAAGGQDDRLGRVDNGILIVRLVVGESHHPPPGRTNDRRQRHRIPQQVHGIFLPLRQAGPHLVQRLLLDIGKDVENPSARLMPLGPQVGVARPPIAPAVGRQPLVGAFMVQAAQGQLFELVAALRIRAASRAACTAGSNKAMRMPMIAITTRSSTSVKPSLILASGFRIAFLSNGPNISSPLV